VSLSRMASEKVGRVVPVLVVVLALGLAALVAQPAMARLRPPLLVLGLGVAGLLILLQQPGLGLAALAALSFTVPFTLGTGTEVALTPPVFLIAGLAGAWLVNGLLRGELRLPPSRTLPPLILFGFAGLVSLLAGRATWDPHVPQPGNLLLVQLGQWGIFALSAAIFLLAGDLGQRGRWLELATWTFLAVGTVVVVEFYLPPLRHMLGWSNPLMANRSMFWTWLAALAAGQLLFNRRLGRLARLWLVALLAAGAYVVWFPLADWASGWVPFTVSAVTVVWLWVWRRSRSAGMVGILLAVVLAITLFPVLFEHAGGEAGWEQTGVGRLTLYEAVLEIAKDHPVLGLGPAAYRYYAFTRWLSLGVGRALYIKPMVSSHNNYIDLYAQTGLVGLGLFAWLLFEMGRTGWRLLPRFRGDFRDGYVYGALAGFVATLVAMMLADWFLPLVHNIGFPGFRTSALAWMFLGGLVALELRSGRGGEGETG
jgi:O-antigen ligase